MAKLEIRDLCVTFAGRDGRAVAALRDISLAMDPGDFVVVLGASGCGKTTLLNCVAGFLQPSAGEIVLDGRRVSGPGRERGVVFQKHALMPWLSVVENVEFALRMRGLARSERRRIALERLRDVGLEDAAGRRIYELSGGMQQRVGIARALASDPEVMLMDEPMGALDALTRESVQELILRIWHAARKMFLLITHSVEEALFLATRLVVMTPAPGRIARCYDVEFSRRYIEKRDARRVKADPAFIRLREEVLELVLRREG